MPALKQRFPRAAALAVAKELCAALKPAADRLIVAGSLRRRREEVGDVEILFIPRIESRPVPGDLFARSRQSLCDIVLDSLLAAGVLAKRESKTGACAWGAKNKLAVHVESGIPVDLFAATPANWWNYLVCRTGPAESNVRIASAAKVLGWQWHAYGSGFSGPGAPPSVQSEREVFEFVGLPYPEPWER